MLYRAEGVRPIRGTRPIFYYGCACVKLNSLSFSSHSNQTDQGFFFKQGTFGTHYFKFLLNIILQLGDLAIAQFESKPKVKVPSSHPPPLIYWKKVTHKQRMVELFDLLQLD